MEVVEAALRGGDTLEVTRHDEHVEVDGHRRPRAHVPGQVEDERHGRAEGFEDVVERGGRDLAGAGPVVAEHVDVAPARQERTELGCRHVTGRVAQVRPAQAGLVLDPAEDVDAAAVLVEVDEDARAVAPGERAGARGCERARAGPAACPAHAEDGAQARGRCGERCRACVPHVAVRRQPLPGDVAGRRPCGGRADGWHGPQRHGHLRVSSRTFRGRRSPVCKHCAIPRPGSVDGRLGRSACGQLCR